MLPPNNVSQLGFRLRQIGCGFDVKSQVSTDCPRNCKNRFLWHPFGAQLPVVNLLAKE